MSDEMIKDCAMQIKSAHDDSDKRALLLDLLLNNPGAVHDFVLSIADRVMCGWAQRRAVLSSETVIVSGDRTGENLVETFTTRVVACLKEYIFPEELAALQETT